MNHQKKLFIFDLDGVLASTSDEHFQAWKAIIKSRFNIEVADEVEEKTKGVSRIDSLNKILESYHLEDSITQQEKEELAYKKNELYKELIENFDQSNLFNGVIELLQFLKQKNILIALGSASKNGPTIIKSTGIDSYFDYIVDPSLVPGKPNPDIFSKAAEYFKLQPDECVGIEDAVSGIQAIKSANMYAIGIGNEKLLKNADIIFDSVGSIDFKFLEQLIGDNNG
ncbi:MAG: beta-phosphoglucomutase [Bacilli bacterium]|nr:beta-phosphoglucomutase [Bacilli bacterium]